jgi:hypothetical protein
LSRKHLILAAGVATAALAIAAPAGATPPTHEDFGPVPYSFSIDCSPYGLDFANEVEGQESGFVETFYGNTGAPKKVVVHDSFRETDTNSVTAEQFDFAGNRVETFDLVAGTRTVVGRSALATDPGHGVVIHDTGRVVFDAPFHVSFSAGPHEVLYGDVDELACTTLAG